MATLLSNVLQYDVFEPNTADVKKRKFEGDDVVDVEPVREPDRVLQVLGDRVTGSVGAPYFAPNGKIAAFHIDGSDDRSHSSFSRGFVLCRLPKFKVWNNNNIVPVLSSKAI